MNVSCGAKVRTLRHVGTRSIIVSNRPSDGRVRGDRANAGDRRALRRGSGRASGAAAQALWALAFDNSATGREIRDTLERSGTSRALRGAGRRGRIAATGVPL